MTLIGLFNVFSELMNEEKSKKKKKKEIIK